MQRPGPAPDARPLRSRANKSRSQAAVAAMSSCGSCRTYAKPAPKKAQPEPEEICRFRLAIMATFDSGLRHARCHSRTRIQDGLDEQALSQFLRLAFDAAVPFISDGDFAGLDYHAGIDAGIDSLDRHAGDFLAV